MINSRMFELELMEDVCPTDVNINPYKPKDELHPQLFVNGKINSRVRLRLLDIADDFIKEMAIRWVKPTDIVLTGSMANYNWTKYSDIDLHIVMDYSKVYKRKEFVEDYFNTKKELWKQNHPKLTIYGFPVEIFVEDVDSPATSNGRYSLEKNKWIDEPSEYDDVRLNEPYIQKKTAQLINDIDDLYDKYKKSDREDVERKIGKEMKKIFNRIKGQRKTNIERYGEMTSWNIIYKLLRQDGYLNKIWDVINGSYDKMLSLKS